MVDWNPNVRTDQSAGWGAMPEKVTDKEKKELRDYAHTVEKDLSKDKADNLKQWMHDHFDDYCKKHSKEEVKHKIESFK